jgi:hypothetical protein
MTRASWATAQGIIFDRLTANRAKLRALGGVDARLPADLVELDQERWDGFSFDTKRAIVELFVQQVIVHQSPTPGHFDPRRIQVRWRQ